MNTSKNNNIKRNKYAFNINDISANNNKFKGSLLDFKSLNRGTYDEIETKDMKIKNNFEKLRLLKNGTLKELIYTNKDIPTQWKNKLDYIPNLLKIFINDLDLLKYVGNGGPLLPRFQKNKKKKKNIQKENITINDLNIDTNISCNEKDNKNKITSTPNLSSSKNVTKYIKFKEKQNYTEKQIIGILEDFKTAYPILKKDKDISDIYIKNKNRKNKNLEDKKNKTFYDDNINNKNALNNINNYTLPNLKLKINKRQNTFRQNIFTNLLPSQQKIKDNFEKNKTFTNFYKKDNNNIINLKNRNDLYLNSNNEIFEKKININNPTIMKYLEGINFFGPYFSYCPPCGNKNLEFYKNLEQNQCLQIIQQIKKNKGRNIIFSEDKKNKKKNENNEEINDINKKNTIEINNSDFMVQQISENSKKEYIKEKYDIVNL